MIWLILCLAIIAWFIWLDWQLGVKRIEADMSLDWHRHNGKHQVRYPDGQLSQPFMLGVAQDYAKMFGGTVEYCGAPRTIPRSSVACTGACGDHYISPGCPRHGG